MTNEKTLGGTNMKSIISTRAVNNRLIGANVNCTNPQPAVKWSFKHNTQVGGAVARESSRLFCPRGFVFGRLPEGSADEQGKQEGDNT